jgi:hypothetical protein
MFAGLKLDATPATPTPVKAPEQSQDRAFVRAVERASRSSEAVLQSRVSGAPVLEHQKVALERAVQALDQIRPGASDDMVAAYKRDPACCMTRRRGAAAR